MKFKTTSRELKNNVPTNYLFKTGYCSLQKLFYCEQPIAYSCGTYGWNYDVYKVDDVYITTGYRSMVGKYIPYELINKYNDKASKIAYDINLKYDDKRKMLSDLIQEFKAELLNVTKS